MIMPLKRVWNLPSLYQCKSLFIVLLCYEGTLRAKYKQLAPSITFCLGNNKLLLYLFSVMTIHINQVRVEKLLAQPRRDSKEN